MRREYVDDLTLAFVAPLGTHYNYVFHVSPLARKPAACATKQAAGAVSRLEVSAAEKVPRRSKPTGAHCRCRCVRLLFSV
jgi:hypothetical protein